MTKTATIEGVGDSCHRPISLVQSTHSTIRLDRPAVYERTGPYEIRLASDLRDIRKAQRLRYIAFFEEGGAIADRGVAKSRRDVCSFDEICDHLVVIDREARTLSGARKPKLVGTYRLLRRDVAARHNGFYSESEFDLRPLLVRQPKTRLLELGRSCVHPDYRSKRVVELLWRGLWLYAQHHAIDALIGCASLPGTDVEANRLPLSFLRHHAAADADWQVPALKHRAVPFHPLAKGGMDLRRGLLSLPPLIKAYLRTGARFSDGIVIDHQFGTTDLFAVMPMAEIEGRYLAHYGQPSCVSRAPAA